MHLILSIRRLQSTESNRKTRSRQSIHISVPRPASTTFCHRPLSKTSLDATLTKPTPHLTAILSRAAIRTRKALPFKLSGQSSPIPTPLPSAAEYRPSSIPSFLSRLATFKLTTYANKPPSIDAVSASKSGWINDGKDRLVCGICKVSWVVVGRDGMTKDAGRKAGFDCGQLY